MSLFWREQTPLIIFYLIQLSLFPLIYWLEGCKEWSAPLYSAFLSFFLLACYLTYRYASHRAFYRCLTSDADSLESTLQKTGNAPLPNAFDQYVEKQFQLYNGEIIQYKNRIEDHIHFITQWVHQMKTPISVIHLTVQGEDHPKFRSIQDELDRLRKGLEMVLYASRLNRFEQDFLVEPIKLAQLVQQAVSENRRLFIGNQVYPELLIPENLFVYSDEKWLLFVLNQLITNAVRYSAGKGKKVAFYAEDQGEKAFLEVRDEGIGIPKEDLHRVFEPYFTGQRGREFRESTGMGLFLVRKICEQLGHQVELESEEGVGTTVRIFFRQSPSYLTRK
jgi:two-component system, OmpR family, sensor histidine kinase YxdK